MISKLFSRFFTPNAAQQHASALYLQAVSHAREPMLYAEYGVADTVDGRFDMIALFVCLYQHKLEQEGSPAAKETSRLLTEQFIADMDQSLREMGVGDMSIGKKVEKIAYAMNGRMQAYSEAWGNDAALTKALLRNAYRSEDGKIDDAARLAAYMNAQEAATSLQVENKAV